MTDGRDCARGGRGKLKAYMRIRLVAVIFALVWPTGSQAQELAGAERARVLEAARARYYNLTGLGVKSFTCGVSFDLGTISKAMLPESDAADKALLQSATFALKVTPAGPTVRYGFPQGAVSQSQEVVAGVTMWITEIVQGFFQAWPAKGLSGPIPADKQVERVERDGDGYRVTAKVSGGTAELRLDKEYVVREIVNRLKDGDIDERPLFAVTSGGLVFSGNETLDRVQEGVTKVRYGIEQGQLDGVLLPSKVHLVVGDHMDVRFGLEGCRVVRR